MKTREKTRKTNGKQQSKYENRIFFLKRLKKRREGATGHDWMSELRRTNNSSSSVASFPPSSLTMTMAINIFY